MTTTTKKKTTISTTNSTYSYVEKTKSDGRIIRSGGSTRRSLKAVDRHLHKIGKPLYIRGYMYKGKSINAGVLVRGESGTIRFGGFSWGYSGEGSRGLSELFRKLGVNVNPFTLSIWPDFTAESCGEWWRIVFNDDGYIVFERKQ